MRGQIYEIAEKTVFTFGGGQSDDTYELVEGQNWWQREIPNEEELAEGLENLEKAGNTVDFVVTYEPPSSQRDFLITDKTDRNHINTYLNGIFEKLTFTGWFFGKLHINKLIPPKYYAVYDGIVVADSTRIKKKKEPKRRAKAAEEIAPEEEKEN